MKILNPAAALIAISATLLMSGCGGTDIDSTAWLIVVGEDTTTVGDVGESWNRLSDSQREIFTSKDNVIGEYIVTYGQKILLINELEAAGYLDNELMISFADSWLNEKSAETARKMLYGIEEDGVSEDDIDFFIDHLGKIVLYTVNPGSETEETVGPDHLPALPRDIVNLIDNLAIGESGFTENGIEVRLDSTATADSALIAQALADTTSLRINAARTMATRRFQEFEDSLRQSMLTDYNLTVDSSVIEQVSLYYDQEAEFPDIETVIMQSDLGSWTAGDLKYAIIYYQDRYSVNPADISWIYSLLDMIHFNSYFYEILENEAPELLDSLRYESERYLLNIASDKFYEDRISSIVDVTQEDMENLFANLEEPLTIPEKRVLQAVIIHSDSVIVYRHMTPEEKEQYILQLEGFMYLAADSSNPQITRPLTVDDIPGWHGDEVFLIDPSDTTNWLGPLELYGGDNRCMFRLIEVIPERNADFDEVEDELRRMTVASLEEQITVDILHALEEKYGITINEDILEKLPPDPGLWVDL